MDQVDLNMDRLNLYDESSSESDHNSDKSSSYSITESELDQYISPDQSCRIDLTALEMLAYDGFRGGGDFSNYESSEDDSNPSTNIPLRYARFLQDLKKPSKNPSKARSFHPVDFKINSLSDLDLSSDCSGSGSDSENERESDRKSQVKYIKAIQYGMYEIDTWYYSPYPGEFETLPYLYICEFCLKYMKLEKTFRYHLGRCDLTSPPGVEIYRNGSLSIIEVDSTLDRLYCQNLCLMGKLFLDDKAVFFDIECFYFYALYEKDMHGFHLRGYFSKDKDSTDGNNVACILVLPPFQKLGYGKLLIDFSYQLSKLERSPGTPEKPLSSLGIISYRSYWAWTLLNILKDVTDISIKELSEMTGMTLCDVLTTLESLKMLKYWKDQTVYIHPSSIESYLNSDQIKRPRLTIDPTKIKWVPPSQRPKTNAHSKRRKHKNH